MITFKKINQFFDNSVFINILTILSILLLIISIWSALTIYFNNHLIKSLTYEGFNNIFLIYRFPLTLLAALIAILTLRATFIRINQTDQQLKSSYRPEIHVKRSTKKYLSENDYTDEEQIIKLIHEMGRVNKLTINIYNIGLAVAKDVEYYFRFDFESAIKHIKEIDSNNEFNFTKSGAWIIAKANKHNNKLFYTFKNSFNIKRSHNFIFSTNDESKYLTIPIPHNFIQFLILNKYLAFKEPDVIKSVDLEQDFPKLGLYISYKDLGGNVIHKKYHFITDIEQVQKPTRNSNRTMYDYEVELLPIDETETL